MKNISKSFSRIISQFLILLLMLVVIACGDDDGTDPTPIDPADRLPQVYINTQGNTIVDEPKVPTTMLIVDGIDTIYHGVAGAEYRGASSQSLFPKKSYGIELWDEELEDIEASLFDMPEEEDWILYAPYTDKTLLRNKIIYDIARDMGWYSSRCELVDLTVNDEPRGVHVFMEKLKRDKGRIDINKLKDDENSGEDLTGGYILKIDKTAGNNLGEGYNQQNSFESAYAPYHSTDGQRIRFLYEYPDAEDITVEQKVYISEYIGEFEARLASDEFTDAEIGYAPMIDVSSFIDFFILNEITNNVDGYRLSTFMHKDKNGKLTMGPIWDFNLAFGNADYCSGGSSNGWAYAFNQRCANDFWQVPFWWERLLSDPTYVSALQDRWTTLRSGILNTSSIHTRIDQDISVLSKAGAIDQNFMIWPVIGQYIWPNNYVGSSYEDESAYFKDWISDRMTWLDSAISDL